MAAVLTSLLRLLSPRRAARGMEDSADDAATEDCNASSCSVSRLTSLRNRSSSDSLPLLSTAPLMMDCEVGIDGTSR